MQIIKLLNKIATKINGLSNNQIDLKEKLELLSLIRSLESRVTDLENELKLYDTREEKSKRKMINLNRNYDGIHQL
jgi:uncharacterized protein YlxW (UPF0749 family)